MSNKEIIDTIHGMQKVNNYKQTSITVNNPNGEKRLLNNEEVVHLLKQLQSENKNLKDEKTNALDFNPTEECKTELEKKLMEKVSDLELDLNMKTQEISYLKNENNPENIELEIS